MKEKIITIFSYFSTIWNYEIVNMDGSAITVRKIILALALLIVGIYLSRKASEGFKRKVISRLNLNKGATTAVESLIFYFLIVFFAVLAMRMLHIPLETFTFLGGALAIGVGFGSQNIMNNFISGLILLIEQPIRVGDIVAIDKEEGRVEHIGPRSTKLVTSDNEDIIVPNSILLEKTLINCTLSDEKVRSTINVGVAYGTSTSKVRDLLLQAAKEHKNTDTQPEPYVLFTNFGESALEFQLMFWLKLQSPIKKTMVESDIRFRIEELFRENNIEIPFPQRTVHIKEKKA